MDVLEIDVSCNEAFGVGAGVLSHHAGSISSVVDDLSVVLHVELVEDNEERAPRVNVLIQVGPAHDAQRVIEL